MFIEPVFGKKFFGREEVLATLHKRVTALKGGYRQNLALTGPMLAGKSSILRHFLMNIKDSDVIPLYIEMGDEDFDMFCTRFMASLLFRYLKATGDKAEGDFKDLKKKCRPHIPKTMKCVDQVCKYLTRKKENDAYEELLTLTSIFKAETGKRCIVILDEFHNLSNFSLKRPFQTFGKFIMIQKNTMYIVSSSQKTLLKEILAKKLSLLFGNFEVIEVNGFDSQTARSFISDKIEGIDFCEDIKNYLIQISQGSPFYLETLSNRYAELIRGDEGKREAMEYLLDTFAELLYESDGILNQYFTNNINFFLEKKARKKFIPIMISLSEGNSTIKDIQADLGKVDKDLGQKLQKLMDMDLIYNSGVFYKISDRLFEYWLKNVYCLKTRSMIDDMDIKYLEFKHVVEEDFKVYQEFCSRSIEDIISDLFKSFSNKKIRVSLKGRKLPKFDNVKTRTLYENVFQVAGRVQDKEWVCHVKPADIAEEHDVVYLSDLKPESKKSKIARKIFIPLKGIENNAFLLAKEQNIWVWDLKQLNNVLRLFGKFELVL